MSRVKILCSGEVHHGLQYGSGRTVCENYDKDDPRSGLFFTDTDHVFEWLHCGHHVRPVIDAEDVVQVAPGNWKASALTLGPQKSLASLVARFDTDEAAVAFHPHTIRCLSYPSERAQLAAVQANWTTIRHISAPPELVQYAAIQQSWYAIVWIRNPTPLMQEIARTLSSKEE